MSADILNHLFTFDKSPYIDRLKIENHSYIVGPYLINKNHWNALIINIDDREFMLLDPFTVTPTFAQKSFDTWCNYYKTRPIRNDTEWRLTSINHPFQTDFYNCGVFVILFIKRFLLSKTIDFDTSEQSLMNERLLIASSIEEFSAKI